MRSLAVIVRGHLHARGWQQNEFAAKVHMTPSAITRILQGRRTLKPRRAAQWCAALRLDPDEASELTDAIHIAAATAHLRRIIKRLEAQVKRRRH